MKRTLHFALVALSVCCVAISLCGAGMASPFHQKQPGTPEILNLSAPVKIHTGHGRVTISDFKLNIDHERLSGATFTLHNNSSKAIIAYVVGVNFYFDVALHKPLYAGASADSWFLNAAPIKPGKDEEVNLTSSIIPHKTVRLLRVDVNLQYAEFSDGSVVGVNAQTLKAKFDENRRAKLGVQNRYASMLNSGVSPADVAKQIETDLKNGKYHGPQYTALAQIDFQLTRLGPKGLASKLLEPPRVPLGPANQ